MAHLEVFEGTWEELAAHAEIFKGRKLRLIVLPVTTATTDLAAKQERMRQLMEQYRDTPMYLADASLVTTAEILNLRRIFTLDRDFYSISDQQY